MPVYEYECTSCGFRFEIRQRFDSHPVSNCPQCQTKARRVIHSVPIIFKGSGFYTTDYGKGLQAKEQPAREEKAAKKEEETKEAAPEEAKK